MQVKCPKCGQVLFVPEDTSGDVLSCLGCGASIAITPPVDGDEWHVENPYASPSSFASQEISGASPAELGSSEIAQALKGTRPWVLFLSILGFIGASLMIFATLMMLVMVSTVQGSGMGLVEVALVLALYGIGSIFFVAFSYLLLMYANRIGDFLRDPTIGRLGAALTAQKSFWKLVGIVAITYFVLTSLITIGLIAAGMAMSLV